MLKVFRAFVSVFVAIEMLFAGVLARSCPRGEVPRGKADGLCAYVDPMIGTGGIPWTCGMLSPAASTPTCIMSAAKPIIDP